MQAVGLNRLVTGVLEEQSVEVGGQAFRSRSLEDVGAVAVGLGVTDAVELARSLVPGT